MSSPDGLPFSQADFLARWMPSSSRAGVILGPPGGDGDLRERRGVTVKLEQVRGWQQRMQEQLDTRRMEECLHLQEEEEDGGESSNDEGLSEDDDDGGQVQSDRPIAGPKKTFEELLEEQLELEDRRLASAEHQSQAVHAPPKRAFLKRGEGLSRFANRRPPPPTAEDPKAPPPFPPPPPKVISRRSSEPAFAPRGGGRRIPVQRKTASLNKENRRRGLGSPPTLIGPARGAERAKVLGSHQRLNTDGPAARSKGGQGAAKRGATAPKRNDDEVGEKDCGSAGKGSGFPGGGDPGEGFDLSFQEKLGRWEHDQRAEHLELGEFELLEQAAEVLSFSSNSSFVANILQMDRMRIPPRRLSSTPVKSPPGGGVRRRSGGGLGSSGSVGQGDDAPEDRAGGGDANVIYTDVWPGPNEPPPFPESEQPYDKRSYQDEESASEASQSEEAEGRVDDSTLLEDGGGERDGVVFDDDDTWNDHEEPALGTPSDEGAPPLALPRKVAVLDKGAGLTNQESDPPPASALMTRLFPSLKPKAQSAPPPPPPPAPESQDPPEETGHNVQSRLLRERLVELEIEIERFKKENAALAKLRQENEKTQDVLRRERSEFKQMKAEELSRFEEYKKEETRKLQKERRVFERHALAARAIPDRKEREEIQLLKQQLSSLQEELRGKESRWACTHNRLRQQADSLRQDNASLRDEVRVLEKLRLGALKNNLASAEKVHEMSPKAAESSTTVIKGVKFASPLDSRGNGNPPQNSTAAAARRNSKEGGIKSSLRKPAASESPSTSLPWTEERSTTAHKSQEKTSNPESSHSCPPKHIVLLNEPQCAELRETESADEVETPLDGKTEKLLANGDRLIVFPNGTKKEVSADGQTVKVTFFNGDTKEITDQRVVYFYAEARTTHVTYPDGLEVLHFPNNQTEKHFPDGRKEITFPDQTVKNLFPGGREQSVLTDGTVIQVHPDGTKEIHFNTGQREVHTAEYKRREYPDGTVKTVYNDGRQETRYPTGRLRVKDKDGNVVTDGRT